GKTALLGALAAQRGATVVANEPQPHRADLVRQAVRGLPPDVVEVRVEDGREFGELEPGGYDRVLVDVPCTGLGALRRRPEARWRHTPSDLATLTPLQLELLTSGLAALRPGGVLAYATCTPHIAETRLLLGDALKGGGFELVPPETVPILSGFGDAIRGGALQLWTDLHGTDAMFLALVRRVT
ncbi:MAG: RsmB/NOP family class I SAM-dependent RNA methyltransferase, partial [Micrococcales bacterium]|nr:RsmB/NOP family class I SAM-dependent RNA methyltransferase [Micrococcales bacterium]